MSSSQRASIVAASVGVVEALKDQRVCRWNHTLKSSQHVIKSHVGSLSQAKNLSFSSSMIANLLVSSLEKEKEVLLKSLTEQRYACKEAQDNIKDATQDHEKTAQIMAMK
ncbi:hypothetical protein JHK82_052433 [Glycine max]|nr:hypothetical protein JHK82_052433 [Glycine max]